MRKIVLPVLAAAFIFIANAAGVYAADFDATYYAQRYPDVANTVGSPCLRHSALTGRNIQKVALCGGAGVPFMADALGNEVDDYLTALGVVAASAGSKRNNDHSHSNEKDD